MDGLLGRKVGMTRVYDADGRQRAVTVIEVGPCVVIQRKTVERDGYSAVKVGFLPRSAKGLTKAELGVFEKAGVQPLRHVAEFRVAPEETWQPGQEITAAAVFQAGGYVDVTGVTKGRGFQGVMKRHGFGGQWSSHGHTMHRRPGAVGMRAKPGRILKNKKLPGHMGVDRVTVQNLRIVALRPDEHVMLVEGAVPGPVGGVLRIRRAIKKASGVS